MKLDISIGILAVKDELREIDRKSETENVREKVKI